MIRGVRANHDSFRTVTFSPGFNVVLADKTDKSTHKDSRNGVGKSLILEIIHFCLGGHKGTSLKKPELAAWDFTLDLTLGGREISVTRSLERPGRVLLTGDTSLIPAEFERTLELNGVSIRDTAWTKILGQFAFGLPLSGPDEQFAPRFRSLFPFFARSGREAFADAFRHHRQMQIGEQQICNAFLLGLGWKYARQWHILRQQEKLLKAYEAASEAGVAHAFAGSLGELEADRVRLEQTAAKTAENLSRFRVHPEYDRIESEASELTSRIHELANENVKAGRLLRQYERSIADEGLVDAEAPGLEALNRVYVEAGVALPGLVRKRFDDVREFHQALIAGRRSFLANEITRLRLEIDDRKARLLTLDGDRAERMAILQTHGALAEYSRLQNLHQNALSRLSEIRQQIKELTDLEEGKSKLKIELETLRQTTRRDLEERAVAREKAIALFNANSQALYEAPGNLIIDVAKNGYQFAVEIERAGATGIENMKVYCYDLTLIQLWSQRPHSPEILIHDSPIFHGVDERQRALAWSRAAGESEALRFQYICMINSDEIPPPEVMGGFDLRPYVRIELTDLPNGCLLGLRF
jgi:uncharacterized protein YydD (DUF2326 family)